MAYTFQVEDSMLDFIFFFSFLFFTSSFSLFRNRIYAI